ncbi:MAG: hypothetical protein NVS3B5_15680 [Sphingomicrobium sp.]
MQDVCFNGSIALRSGHIFGWRFHIFCTRSRPLQQMNSWDISVLVCRGTEGDHFAETGALVQQNSKTAHAYGT